MQVKKSVKEKVRETLRKDKFISSVEMGNEFGVTRSAVSRAVKELQSEGYDIEVKSHSGYRLIGTQDVISIKDIYSKLKTKYIAKDIMYFDEIDSTNNYAKQLARSNVAEGTVVLANTQLNGKGRLGRTFISPKDCGIYYSLILRPNLPFRDSQLITAAAAVAVSRAVDEICGTKTSIKWVNDIYLNGKKICGILTEGQLSIETGKLDYAVIGIGLNVRKPKINISDDLSKIITNIEAETGERFERNDIIAAISNKFEEILDDIDSREFLKEYKEKSNLIGRDVVIVWNGNEEDAKVIDIGEDASLIVKLADGSIRSLNSGEAKIKKQSLV